MFFILKLGKEIQIKLYSDFELHFNNQPTKT